MRRPALLASCVNGGGVFRIDAAGIECLSVRDTAGMCAWPSGMVWARQDPDRTDLALIDRQGLHNVRLTDEALDLHDAVWHDGSLYLVATQTNTVLRLDAQLREQDRWTFDGQHDSQHLNSICVHEGRLLVSRFGDFNEHREYKGATLGAGQVLDLYTGQVIIRGLSQPHSLKSHDGALWLCDSETQRVVSFRGGQQVEEILLDGYPRGLMMLDDRILVGLSQSRNVANAGVQNGCIVELAGLARQEVSRTHLPAPEIYDLLSAPADMPDLQRGAITEARTALHEAVGARNTAASSSHALGARVSVLEMEASIADERSKRAGSQHERLLRRLKEDSIWEHQLRNELGGLREQSALTDQAMRLGSRTATAALAAIEELREAIAERDRYIDCIRSSRSWRWTKPLRRAEPRSPAPLALARKDVLVDLAGARDALETSASREAVPVSDQASVQVIGVAFQEHADPVVSILVTAYGEYEATRTCLESIAECGDATPFEVLLVEDNSGEDRLDRFATVPGLRYVRNASNMGYLRSVNAAAQLARGRYLCLLNNDTRVHPGWLDAMIDSYRMLDSCGLVGSRLLYPDGRLQEAGGIVWSDASGCNVGRDGDPHAQAYRAARRVDYVSGASMMIPTHLFRELEGFDERFTPAYYEDTDLAFRVRKRGLQVYYQPRSIVEHIEGLSHGTDSAVSGKAFQARNREVFLEKWRGLLELGHFTPGEHAFLARERSQLVKSVLIVDHHAPRTDRDAGSRAIWAVVRALQGMGLAVRFWSLASSDEENYLETLRRHGVDVMVGNARSFARWLREHGCYIDNVILSRPGVAIACIDAVRSLTRAKVAYYGHDIHYLRIDGRARLHNVPALAHQAKMVRGVEEQVWRSVDVVLYPTDEETAIVTAFNELRGVDVGDVATIPLLAYDDVLASPDLSADALAGRREIFFVGNYEHAPNEDAVVWFAREIWPNVRKRHPELHLVIAGPNVTSPVAELSEDSSIDVTGHISERELIERYHSARVVIAPLRFGAGLKGKVVEAMRHGVPVVTTPVGAQGLARAACIKVTDDASTFCDAVCGLVESDEAWRVASQAGIGYVKDHFSTDAIAAVLMRALDAAPYPDVASRRARLSVVTETIAAGQSA